ncbi:MAG: hypothetical protein ACRDHV_01730 [Actinomycetota bacterium]
MEPAQQLTQIGRYTDHLLDSLGAQYVRIGAPRIPNTIDSPLAPEWEAQFLVNAMRHLAMISAFLEGAASQKEALRRREDIVIQYIDAAKTR